jgi:uncharacterized protein (TIGR00369 family)
MSRPIEEHYRRLEHLYRVAPINAFYEPQLQVSEGAAEFSIEIQPKMHHAVGAVHGSVYFKALDDSAFFAANSMETEFFLLTASFNVHLIRPVSEGCITAHGRLIERTGRVFFAESRLLDSQGNVIGTGSGTFMRSKLLLGLESGYA